MYYVYRRKKTPVAKDKTITEVDVFISIKCVDYNIVFTVDMLKL